MVKYASYDVAGSAVYAKAAQRRGKIAGQASQEALGGRGISTQRFYERHMSAEVWLPCPSV